jgi:hypothetical protein
MKEIVVTPLSIGNHVYKKVNCDTVAMNYIVFLVDIYNYIPCNISLLLFDEEFLTQNREKCGEPQGKH